MINPSILQVCYCLFLMTFLHTTSISAQPWSTDEPQKPTVKRHHAGLLVGRSLGGTIVSENMEYEPLLLMLYASFPLSNSDSKRSRLFLVTEPQLNFFVHENDVKHFEVGANLGLQYRWYFNPVSWFFTQISTGPHYISLNSPRQAGGFIFSDNLAFGISIKTVKALRTEVQYRLRHLSNASIKRPNAGINNHFIMLGLALDW